MSTATAIQPSQIAAVKHARIPTLDGWRGIAILLVLLAHFGPLETGQHGVTIFFVLSGFLITSRLIEEHQQTGTLNLRTFYVRRFFRLMPCAWTFLLLVSLINIGISGRFFPWRDLAGSLFFFRNYLDRTGDHLVTAHFWSLSIEEQFYLVWPCILLFAFRYARWISLCAAAAIAAFRFLNWQHLDLLPIQGSLGTEIRADALFIGCAAALWLPYLRPYLRPWLTAPLLAVLLFCIGYYGKLIPLHESLVIAALLLITSQFSTSAFSAVLQQRWLSKIGELSYSLYVWQQLIAMMPIGLGVKLPLLLLIPSASFYLIERPVRAFGKRLERERFMPLALKASDVSNPHRASMHPPH